MKARFYVGAILVVMWMVGVLMFVAMTGQGARASGEFKATCAGSLTVINTGDDYRVICVDGPHKLTLVSGAAPRPTETVLAPPAERPPAPYPQPTGWPVYP